MTASSPPSPPSRSPDQQALTLQIELTAILARGKGIERLLRGWQQRTHEGAAVFDRLGNPLARNSGFSDAALDAVRRMLADDPPSLGQSRTVPLEQAFPLAHALPPAQAGSGQAEGAHEIEVEPFAGNDVVRGFLARAISAQPVAALAAPALRSLLALEYERHWLMDEPSRRRRAQQLDRLLDTSSEASARTLLRTLGMDAPALRGVHIEARDETHAEVLVDDLAAMFSTPLIGRHGRVVQALLADDPLPALGDYGLTVPLGVGTVQPPHHAARSMRQATLALETSRRVGAPIAYRDGGAHDFLLQVASAEYLEAFAGTVLGPIERAKGGDELLATLNAWLIGNRSIEATADRMQVHRHTVRNRIQRVAQLTGHDLDSIDAQTELWLALKARGYERTTDQDWP